MKLVKWVVLAFAVVLLAACGEQTYEPRDINPETDVCYMCNMSITHVDYAAQVVLKNGDHVVFDDLGCLMEYVLENGEDDIGASYVRGTDSATWVNLEDATYVYAKDNWTPMNYGVLAFSTAEEANSYMQQQPGKLLAYEDLKTFEWGVHEH